MSRIQELTRRLFAALNLHQVDQGQQMFLLACDRHLPGLRFPQLARQVELAKRLSEVLIWAVDVQEQQPGITVMIT